MPEVTRAIAVPRPRQIHIRRGILRCVSGPQQGQSWKVDGDLIRVGSLETGEVVLGDPTVSRKHAEVVRTRDGILLRDLDSTNGTFVGEVRVREVFLAPETHFRIGRTELVFSPRDEVIDIHPSGADHFEGLVGASVAMREVYGILERIAPTDLTVLVTGETGTGKELVSRALATRSHRASGPFVVFDCGAAPESLVESELFGHQRGAFTGALQGRPGVFELADGGTIFLDEVGELPLQLQPKLLRVLEQREVRRIGGSETRSVDVRVVAATNRLLLEDVENGKFREDLYYRLSVVEIHLPPVRERLGDLPLLVAHILDRARHNRGVDRLSADVRAIFDSWHWPGNVRELKNVIERALPFCDGDTITIDALPAALRSGHRTADPPPAVGVGAGSDGGLRAALPFKDAKDQLIEAFERRYLVDLLAQHQGNVSKAARAARLDRKSITRLMKKHGVTR